MNESAEMWSELIPHTICAHDLKGAKVIPLNIGQIRFDVWSPFNIYNSLKRLIWVLSFIVMYSNTHMYISKSILELNIFWYDEQGAIWSMVGESLYIVYFV